MKQRELERETHEMINYLSLRNVQLINNHMGAFLSIYILKQTKRRIIKKSVTVVFVLNLIN